jgi:putative membrane protein
MFRSYSEEEAPMRALVTILALVLTVPAFAADVPQKTQDFISAATIGNKFEIDTSNLALKYGQGDDVKSFAQKMITDHTKAGEELKAALSKASIKPPPDELDLMHKARYAKLRYLTTASGFDASYTHEQVKAHKDTIATFKDYAANGPTPEIKAFASQLLPTLEEHLKMAKDLKKKLSPKS